MNRTETEMCFLISSVDQGKNHKIHIKKGKVMAHNLWAKILI